MYLGNVFFDNDGNHQRRKWYWTEGVYLPNFVFKDDLVLQHAYTHEVKWLSLNNGISYISFINDLERFIPLFDNSGDVKKKVSGFFTFRNNGGRTGLIPTKVIYKDYTTSPKVISATIKGAYSEGLTDILRSMGNL